MSMNGYESITLGGSAAGVPQRRWRSTASALVLGLITTSERVTFKVLVDRVAPFRALLTVAVVVCYATVMLAVTSYKYLCTDEISAEMRKFPQAKIAGMAALDTLQLYSMMLSASAVSPAGTVLLLQASIPLTLLLSWATQQPAAPQAWQHLFGASLIAVSTLIATLPPVIGLVSGNDITGGVGTLVYLMSCLPASVSTLYKERALRAHAQPMDPNYLNLCLAVYQLLISLVALPLAYRLQAWSAYPASTLGLDIREGCACLLADTTPSSSTSYSYPTVPHCQWALLLLFMFVFATSCINSVIDDVLTHGSESLMYRAITASAAVSFFVLGVSCRSAPGLLGTSITWTDSISLAVLLSGLEIYHRATVPETEFLTEWT
jgi:hypothetical protein